MECQLASTINQLKDSTKHKGKANMIKKLVLPDIVDKIEKENYKFELINFFKSHSNLENKVDWNKVKTLTKKDFDTVFDIANNSKSSQKKEIASDLKNIFKSVGERKFEIVGENTDWLFVAPLSYEAAVYCNSSKNQGAGAKWCIGYEKNDRHWTNYVSEGSIFIMAFNKNYKNLSKEELQTNLKYMIMIQQDKRGKHYVWNQLDNELESDLNQFSDNREFIDEMFDKTKAAFDNEKKHRSNEIIFKCNEILKNVTEIDKNTLPQSYREIIIEITIPDNVISIGDRGFYNCKNLTSITIPNSVTSIGNDAFSCCKNLKSVSIPNSVTSIGNCAFKKSSLESITIPDGVTSIRKDAFAWCENLKSITIPNSVTSIGNFAFFDCSNLTSINIPNNVTFIGNDAFSCCKNLKSITIPNSVTSIGRGAFDLCENLKSITIPDSVTFIGNDAFSWCKNLIITISKNFDLGLLKNAKLPNSTSIKIV